MFTAQSVTDYWHSSLRHQGYGVDNFMHIQQCEWMSVFIVCCGVCIYEMKKKPCEQLTRPMIFCLLSFTLQSEHTAHTENKVPHHGYKPRLFEIYSSSCDCKSEFHIQKNKRQHFTQPPLARISR